jgi:hypothetical protein
MHQRHYPRHLTAERTRIHHQAAANGTGNAFAKLESRQSAIDDGLDHRAKLHRSADRRFHIVDDHAAEAFAELDHQAAHAAVAHQQIGSGAETHRRNFATMRRRHRGHQLTVALDHYEKIGRTANPKRRQIGERAPRFHTRAKVRPQFVLKHAHLVSP